MPEMSYAEALSQALVEIMEQEPRAVLIGGAFGPLGKRFANRIKQPPIAELGYCGIAVGAAMTGLRPIVSLGTASFIYEALPQVLNEASVARYGSAGQLSVPVVFHVRVGIRGAGAMQHSAAPQPIFWNTPGLQIAVPSSPADAKGLMLTAALRSQDPTIFIDHTRLHRLRGPVPDGPTEVPFGVAQVKREGKDVTVLATSVMVPRALEAAEQLAREDGIAAEVVDLRTLVPLDKAAVLASVAKTGRVLIADETQKSCGVGAELAALICEEAFFHLKAPVRRVAIPDVPIPYSKSEEDYVTPGSHHIMAGVREICR
ncbi:MAG: alpha-ketoacid dehydrogenase subunit beta [Deltaproteobacteria bacterium]|nr:alpha-ketoacid dehydrogenase subunit beta [Deltaproteobacteria bacterium]